MEGTIGVSDFYFECRWPFVSVVCLPKFAEMLAETVEFHTFLKPNPGFIYRISTFQKLKFKERCLQFESIPGFEDRDPGFRSWFS